jgi:hypothetical protein
MKLLRRKRKVVNPEVVREKLDRAQEGEALSVEGHEVTAVIDLSLERLKKSSAETERAIERSLSGYPPPEKA